jgi:hypothetical protein
MVKKAGPQPTSRTLSFGGNLRHYPFKPFFQAKTVHFIVNYFIIIGCSGRPALVDFTLSHIASPFITHRLRNVIEADKIVVVEDGRITSEGRNEELLKNNTLYAKMYELQQRSR